MSARIHPTLTLRCGLAAQVVTSNKMFAGTDSKVLLTLVGESEDDTWTPVLDQSKKHFEKGNTDVFVLGRDTDFGEVRF